jgi:hypothetical protein
MKQQLTQTQLFWKSHKYIADGNKHFLEMIKHPTNPLTKRDLKALIAKYPNRWERFAGFLNTKYIVA